MRIRELIVAIKVKADLTEAKAVEAILGRIARIAANMERSVMRSAGALSHLDRNLNSTGRSGRAAGEGVETFSRAAGQAAKAAKETAKAANEAGDKLAEAGRKARRAATDMAEVKPRDAGGRFTGGGGGSRVPEMPGARSAVLGAGAVVGAGIVAGAGFAANIAMERESLRATLKNLEGDEDKAAQVFQNITKLAADTPFAIEEVTSAFISLRSRGVDPTNEKLTALGDLASTFGGNIQDMGDSIAAAARGELDPIEKFGVSAKIAGDKIALSFKGQTLEVERTADAVTNALVSFGKMEGVQGAMAGQMDTLKGKWSNFQDAIFSAVDEAMTSSGALEEMKGLLGDLTNTGTDAAGVFGGFLAESIRDLREWLKTLTREDIEAWMQRAADTTRDVIEAILGLTSAVATIVNGIAEFTSGMEGADEGMQIMIVALGAMALAGGGLAGIFAAAGAAAVMMGIKFGDATDKAIADVERLKRAGIMKAFQNANGGMSEAETVTAGEDSSIEEFDIEGVRRANQTGFGEEFFRTSEQQLVDLGVEQAVEPGDLEGQVARTAARGGLTADQMLARRAGFDTRIGVNKEAAKLLDAIDERREKDISERVEKARKRGATDDEVEVIRAAREAELDARSKKAAASFTSALRKEGDIDSAIEAGLAELEDKKKKGGKKGGRKKKAGEKETDILQALGLKGPGSILEDRPTPQSLIINTTVVIKAAETITVPITIPPGSTLGGSMEEIGEEVGKAVDAGARDKINAIVDDAWSLRWEALARARGGGRTPPSVKKRGKPL
jgi:chorismate mutase